MLTESDEYKFVSEHFRWEAEKVIAVFNSFIRLFSAILGGSIYLCIQSKDLPRGQSLQCLSDLLVILSAFVASILVWQYTRSRIGYRKRMSILGGKDEEGNFRIPLPRGRGDIIIEGVVIATMAIIAAAFWIFNPFALFAAATHSN